MKPPGVAPWVRSAQPPPPDERRPRIVPASAPPWPSRTDPKNASPARARQHPGIEPGQAATDVLADLEHVLRVPRPAVRLRAPERERQPHIPDIGRGTRADSAAVDRGAADRTAGAADCRLPLGSDVDAAGSPPTVLSARRTAGLHRSAAHAALAESMGCGGGAFCPPCGPPCVPCAGSRPR